MTISSPADPPARKRAVPRRVKAKERDESSGAVRQEVVLRHAAQRGLLGSQKDGRITGRVSRALIEAARARTNLLSDTELVTYALAKVALEDDFGETLLSLKGTVPETVDLEF